MRVSSTNLARASVFILATTLAALDGCGGDEPAGSAPADGGADAATEGPDGGADDGGGGAEAGREAGAETGADAAPAEGGLPFNNPKLAVSGADGPGSVLASLHLGTSWYVGGQFARVSPYTASNLIAIGTTGAGSATPIATCDIGAGFNGAVNAVAQAGGAIFVGGNFTTYKGASANRIAKLDATTCALDTTFMPATNGGFNEEVRALAVNATAIFAGGLFTGYRGGIGNANRIAKLDANGVLDTTFSPPGATANGFTDGGAVHALAVDGTSVYAGGAFTAHRGASGTANRIAKLDIVTGERDPVFSPAPNGFNSDVYALAVDATDVYAGGAFTVYRSAQSVSRIAKLSIATGDADLTFSPPGNNGFDQIVYALALDATSLYAGGAFTAYRAGPSSALRIAKLALVDGTIDTAFSPPGAGLNGFDGIVRSLALAGADLYVGGDFGAYRGASAPANRFAKLKKADGEADAAFLPAQSNQTGFAGGGVASPAGATGTTVVTAALVSGTTLWLGGRFSLYGGISANGIAKLHDATFTVDTAFSPAAENGFKSPSSPGTVYALAGSGNTLYVGGDFTQYRGVASSANRIAKLDATNGAQDTTFSPAGPSSNGFDGVVRALVANATDVYAGGDFIAYRGLTYSANRLAKLSAAGAIDTAFSPPGLSSNGFNSGSVYALALDGTAVYAGGTFTAYRAASANRIAKIDRATGLLDVTFCPPAANGFTDIVNAIALDATNVYAGGSFTTYRGAPANRIARLTISNGALDPTFSPPAAANGFSDGAVASLAVSPTHVYAAGTFTSYRGATASANRLARIEIATGSVDTTFSPPGATVNGFEAAASVVRLGTSSCGGGCGPVLLVGGAFQTYRGARARSLAILDPVTGNVK